MRCGPLWHAGLSGNPGGRAAGPVGAVRLKAGRYDLGARDETIDQYVCHAGVKCRPDDRNWQGVRNWDNLDLSRLSRGIASTLTGRLPAADHIVNRGLFCQRHENLARVCSRRVADRIAIGKDLDCRATERTGSANRRADT